jgi:hypothetical protein
MQTIVHVIIVLGDFDPHGLVPQDGRFLCMDKLSQIRTVFGVVKNILLQSYAIAAEIEDRHFWTD